MGPPRSADLVRKSFKVLIEVKSAEAPSSQPLSKISDQPVSRGQVIDAKMFKISLMVPTRTQSSALLGIFFLLHFFSFSSSGPGCHNFIGGIMPQSVWFLIQQRLWSSWHTSKAEG